MSACRHNWQLLFHDVAEDSRLFSARGLTASFAELSGSERTQLLCLLAKVGARIGEADPLAAG